MTKPLFSKPPLISKRVATAASFILAATIVAVGVQWKKDKLASKSAPVESTATPAPAAVPETASMMLATDAAAAKAAIEELGGARTTITAQLHQINRPELVDALIKAAKAQVRVHVLLSRPSAVYAKKNVDALLAAGVQITIDRGADMLSGSLIVIDKEKVVAGSMWFGKSASRALEHMLVSNRPQLVSATLAAIEARIAAGEKP